MYSGLTVACGCVNFWSIPHVRTSRKVGWWVGFTKHTPSGAAALGVVLISKTFKGVAAFQKLTPLVARRRWW